MCHILSISGSVFFILYSCGATFHEAIYSQNAWFELPDIADALLYLPHVWKESKIRRLWGRIRGRNKHYAGEVSSLTCNISAPCDITNWISSEFIDKLDTPIIVRKNW